MRKFVVFTYSVMRYHVMQTCQSSSKTPIKTVKKEKHFEMGFLHDGRRGEWMPQNMIDLRVEHRRMENIAVGGLRLSGCINEM